MSCTIFDAKSCPKKKGFEISVSMQVLLWKNDLPDKFLCRPTHAKFIRNHTKMADIFIICHFLHFMEYFLGGKGGRRVGLTILSRLPAECHEIWEPRPPGTLRACPGLYMDCFTFLALYAVFSLDRNSFRYVTRCCAQNFVDFLAYLPLRQMKV